MSGGGEEAVRGPKPRPMAEAPRDGRILRLLVDYDADGSDHPLENARLAWTIGANCFDHDGEDQWSMAGWSWTHDCFTAGNGRVIGWLPFHDDDAPATDDVRYFIEGDDDARWPLTLAELHKEIGAIWDAAPGDGWIEGISGLKVYEARVISRAVEVSRSEGVDCPVCCGGMVAEEIAEASDGEECSACDGVGKVHSDDHEQAWTSQFDEIVEYEMTPPLPPLAKGGGA